MSERRTYWMHGADDVDEISPNAVSTHDLGAAAIWLLESLGNRIGGASEGHIPQEIAEQLEDITALYEEGNRVEVRGIIDRYPHFRFDFRDEPKMGTVSHGDGELLYVRMDENHPELDEWDNCIEFQADDTAACIRPIQKGAE